MSNALLLMRRRMMMKSDFYYTGYKTIGNPTIVDNILEYTPSYTNGIVSPKLFSPKKDDRWRIHFKMKRNKNDSRWYIVFCILNNDDGNCDNDFIFAIYTQRTDGTLFSIDLNPKDNANGYTMVSVDLDYANDWIDVTLYDNADYYYINVIDAGGNRSTNKERKTTEGTQIYGGYITFGNTNSNLCKYSYDLSSIEVYINDKLWWKPIK